MHQNSVATRRIGFISALQGTNMCALFYLAQNMGRRQRTYCTMRVIAAFLSHGSLRIPRGFTDGMDSPEVVAVSMAINAPVTVVESVVGAAPSKRIQPWRPRNVLQSSTGFSTKV